MSRRGCEVRPRHIVPRPPVERIQTPLNELGLVDALATVEAVRRSTIHDWRRPVDTHHLYWPSNRYPKGGTQRKFRELPIHKIMLPRDFHDYLHLATEPPPIPEEELMQYIVTSYEAARAMFDSARLVIQKQREKDRLLGRLPRGNVHGGVRSRQRAISKNREHFEEARRIYDSVPVEARVVDIDVNANLGRIARTLAVVVIKPKKDFKPVLQAA